MHANRTEEFFKEEIIIDSQKNKIYDPPQDQHRLMGPNEDQAYWVGGWNYPPPSSTERDSYWDLLFTMDWRSNLSATSPRCTVLPVPYPLSEV